jgi:uncharacterized phage protein (TIGR02218 family)
MALFIKATSKAVFGSEVVAFTSNTRDMTLPGHPGVTFKANPGPTPTIVEQTLDEPTTMEFQASYGADSFTQTDVVAGRWNFAEVEVFSACWDDGEESGGDDKREYGELLHFRGNLGEFKDYQTYFKAEIRGMISRLSNEVNFVTSRLCRAPELGDPVWCKKNLAGTVTIGSITYDLQYPSLFSVAFPTPSIDAVWINISGFPDVPPDDYFANGKITGVDGVNAGISREIASSDLGGGVLKITLKRPFPYLYTAIDAFTLTAGCDKTLETCKKFGNVANRRAEDWIPGIEAISRIPGL